MRVYDVRGSYASGITELHVDDDAGMAWLVDVHGIRRVGWCCRGTRFGITIDEYVAAGTWRLLRTENGGKVMSVWVVTAAVTDRLHILGVSNTLAVGKSMARVHAADMGAKHLNWVDRDECRSTGYTEVDEWSYGVERYDMDQLKPSKD